MMRVTATFALGLRLPEADDETETIGHFEAIVCLPDSVNPTEVRQEIFKIVSFYAQENMRLHLHSFVELPEVGSVDEIKAIKHVTV